MDDRLKLLRTFKLFASLDLQSSTDMLPKFERIIMKAGEILFLQGDYVEDVYFLVRGKVSCTITNYNGKTRLINTLTAPATIGELNAITHDHHTVTAELDEDCEFLKLTSNDFIEIINQHPSILYEIVNPLINRSQRISHLFATEKKRRHIGIIAANKEVEMSDFALGFQRLTSNLNSIEVISEFDIRQQTYSELESHVNQLLKTKKPRKKIIYIIKSFNSDLAKLCFKNSDMVYIIANQKAPVYLDNYLLKKLERRKLRGKPNPELILIYPENTIQPSGTKQWLALALFHLHHQIRINHHKDYHRLLRFMRGKPNGLVLGGGGTRGWAHLGVIKALREKKITIDAIGGTSVGAIVGACFAANLSFADAYERFDEIMAMSHNSVSWRNFTWPAISLFSGKNFTVALQTVFENLTIEDLWIPFFCISTNLSTYSEVAHTQGLLWEKLRASAAVPGVIPPMTIEGDMHFDGGLLNNLPIDVMRKQFNERGKIIGVQVIGEHHDEPKYNFPPILGFIPTFLARFRIAYRYYRLPSFFDTFFHALTVGSLLKSKRNSLDANLLVNLNLKKYGMLSPTSKKTEELLLKGYDAALEELEKANFNVKIVEHASVTDDH